MLLFHAFLVLPLLFSLFLVTVGFSRKPTSCHRSTSNTTREDSAIQLLEFQEESPRNHFKYRIASSSVLDFRVTEVVNHFSSVKRRSLCRWVHTSHDIKNSFPERGLALNSAGCYPRSRAALFLPTSCTCPPARVDRRRLPRRAY